MNWSVGDVMSFYFFLICLFEIVLGNCDCHSTLLVCCDVCNIKQTNNSLSSLLEAFIRSSLRCDNNLICYNLLRDSITY